MTIDPTLVTRQFYFPLCKCPKVCVLNMLITFCWAIVAPCPTENIIYVLENHAMSLACGPAAIIPPLQPAIYINIRDKLLSQTFSAWAAPRRRAHCPKIILPKMLSRAAERKQSLITYLRIWNSMRALRDSGPKLRFCPLPKNLSFSDFKL